MKLKNLAASFFAHNLTRQVKELYSSALILNFATSAINIFEPIFLYLVFISRFNLSQTLQMVLVFYLLVYIVYFFVLPLGAKFARRFGYENSIAFSTVFTIIFYASLFQMGNDINFIYSAIVAYAIAKAFYWPAFHSDFARFSVDGEQGRQIGNLTVLLAAVAIIAPLFGGFVLEYFGFSVLFVIVIIVAVISNVPLLVTKEEFKPRPFSYFGAYKRMFGKKNRKKFIAHLGFGEELIALVIWPIFIYVVIEDFLKLGILVSVSIALAVFVYLYIGRITDKADQKAVLKFGVIFSVFGWLARILTRSILGVFFVDSYSRIAKQVIAIPFTAVTYEKAQDTDVMTGVVFFEMSLVVGKILAIVLSLLLLFIFAPGWNAIFILGGLMTLLYLLF